VVWYFGGYDLFGEVGTVGLLSYFALGVVLHLFVLLACTEVVGDIFI
jgi:hypothetical protein